YAARWLAKNVVAANLAERFEVQIAYVIGRARPISLNLETYGTGRVPDLVLQALIEKHVDLRPHAIISRFRLQRPIYRQTATYGHFGRPELDLPWERTDLAAALARDAGIAPPVAALSSLAIFFPLAALAAGFTPAAQARIDDPTLAFPLVLALFISWLFGGYVAGRMSGYRRSWHGLMSAIWGLFVALVIALIAG